MQLTYTLTLAHFRAAQRLHIRQKMYRRLNFLFWQRLIPILAPFAALGAIYLWSLDSHGAPHGAAYMFGAACGLVLAAIYIPSMREYYIRKGFKSLFPPARTDRHSSIDIDEDRIFSQIPGVSEGKIFWGGVVAFAQDEKVTLIYIREKVFLVIPTPAMSPEQRAEVNDLVARHVEKRKP
ncbi:MAG: YcxB family protein [Terracidiphilus sp.]|jgi:hypothetical protein